MWGAGERRVGIGLRSEIAASLFASPSLVDFVEVVAETCFVDGDALAEARAASAIWPVIPHGVKLSLGSADGIELDRARRLGALARTLRAPLVSEHVAITRGGRREIGHLTPLPMTAETVAIVARNVRDTRRELPDVPLLLENVATTLDWPGNTLSEPSFYQSIVAATECDLLLDVANLYANAVNGKHDPSAWLAAIPLDRVAMIHIAGGVFDGGFYCDSHAHAVPAAVFELLESVFAARPNVPVVLERDASFPPFRELAAELTSIAEARARAGKSQKPPRPPPPHLPSEPSKERLRELAREQAHLATLLTTLDAPAACAPFDPVAVSRTREVLDRKRLDDALPLLPRLLRARDHIEAIGRAAIPGWPRPAERVAIADAMRLAEAASAEPTLASLARYDALVLRARFLGPDAAGNVRPRRGPFVSRTQLDARTLWIVKGPGESAPVRIWEGPRR